MKTAKIKNFILNTIFPPLCISCRSNLRKEEVKYLLCKNCEEKIEIKTNASDRGFSLHSPTSYSNRVVKKIIHSFKYKKVTTAQECIKMIIQKYLKTSGLIKTLSGKNWTVTPIPIHKNKRRRRGFNQSLLISKILSNKMQSYGIKSEVTSLLQKTKKTKPQMNLPLNQRRGNIKNCFQINKKEKIRGKNILLVDDVCTSGSTLKEAIKALEKEGPEKIITFTIAKT